MRSHPAYRRRITALALAALVVYAPLNCLASAARGCKQMSAPLAISDWHGFSSAGLFGGCENESGCICRGATLVAHEDGRSLAPVATDWMSDLPDSPFVRLVETANGQPDASYFAPPPLSGRILRAHLASLVI